MTTSEAILRHVRGLPEGAPIKAKELLHLGERASIDQALSRLVRRGQLIRAGRGLYTHPVASRFGQRAPTPENFVRELSARTGETVAPNGASSANLLGLSTQNPSELVYLTSGRSRSFLLGKQKVELRHAPPWMLQQPASQAGHIVRALAWMGKEQAPEFVGRLRRQLKKTDRTELLSMRAQVPGWMAEALSPLAS